MIKPKIRKPAKRFKAKGVTTPKPINGKMTKEYIFRSGSANPKPSAQKIAGQSYAKAASNTQELIRARSEGKKISRGQIRKSYREQKRWRKTFKAIANEAAVTKRLAITTAGTTATSIGNNIASAITANASTGQSGRNDVVTPEGQQDQDNQSSSPELPLGLTWNGSGENSQYKS